MGPNALSHALRAPFEKLGSVARKQRSVTHHGVSREDGEESQIDSSPARHELQYPHHRPPHKRHTVNGSNHTQAAMAHIRPKEQHQAHHQLFFRGSEGAGPDEIRGDYDFHVRKLFLKGQRVLPPDERWALKRSEPSATAKVEQRHFELRHLESALARESAFRERQAEADRKSQLEAETSERIRQVEGEIYLERLQYVLLLVLRSC